MFFPLHLIAQVDISGQSSDFADNAIAASQAIHAAIDTLWTSVQQGGTYKGLCKIGAQLALATMIFFIFGWYKKVLDDNSFSWAPITDFIWPLCIIGLLVTSPGNPDGARLWAFTTGIRNVINNADQTVLESVSSTANLAQSRAEAGKNVAFESTIKSVATRCNGKATPEEKKACWDDNRTQVSKGINGQQSNPWLDGLKGAFDAAYTLATDPNQAKIDAVTAGVNLYENAFASVIKGIVLAIGMAFTSTVCSHCADRLWSLVTTVHWSGSSLTWRLPALIIGSMVKVMPGSSAMPVPAVP